MAVEWYYKAFGPISSQHLKKLAVAETIIPSTPLRRVSGSEISPWTRAGAIQGLFPGNVIDQLGPPICDDCGQALRAGKCPKCIPAVPPTSAPPPFVEINTAINHKISSVFRVERKYPNLRTYAI